MHPSLTEHLYEFTLEEQMLLEHAPSLVSVMLLESGWYVGARVKKGHFYPRDLSELTGAMVRWHTLEEAWRVTCCQRAENKAKRVRK